MDKLKQWVGFTVVGVLVVLAAGWFLLVSPKRSEAADLNAQAASKATANQQLAGQLAILKAQAKELPQQQAKLAAVAAKIPDNPALPALVRALSKAADDAGVELVSMAPSPPAAVAAAAAPATAAGAGVTAARPAVGSSAAGALQSIGLNLNVVGGYFQVEQFLDRLESLGRAFKVTGFTLAPGSNPLKPAAAQGAVDSGSSLTAAVTGQVYMATGRSTASAPSVTTGK
jgi:Tfp pilus assembly protein PilO